MTGRLRVVIVEDVEADAEMMAIRLVEAGYQPDWQRVYLEQDFLASLDAPPDLILADWSLPRFSGMRALELTRSRGLDIPFIIVSGSIGEEVAVEALHSGVDDYLNKDRPARLGVAVRRAIEEKEAHRAQRRNHEALLLLTRAVEHSPVSVVITGRSGDIEYVNPKFTEVSGYDFDEVRGRNPRLLKSGEMSASFYRELWETIIEGKEWRGEFHNRRKDGTLYWERASISPVRDSSGVITHFVEIKEDVTTQKALESQLLQAQKMESVGRLAGGIAHDFNNLLTIINGYGDMVLNKLPQGDPLREPVAEMREAGAQAARLTQQLLAFSRRQVIAPKPLNLNSLVSGAESLLRRILGEDIELFTELEPALGTVVADTGQLQQVLLNLAVNARDAMPGGGTLTIKTANLEGGRSRLTTEAGFVPEHHVLVTVSDTGLGMDKETLSHLFEPFFTTKGSGEGTGLGLATVYGIVKQLGGDILVSSEPGCGSEFRVYLPRIEAQLPDAEASEAVPMQPVGVETILVVEDQPAVARLAARDLDEFGYRTLVASGYNAALGIAENHPGPIHLLLTDVVMPGMTGKNLADSVRLLRPSVKVLFMSGYTHNVIAHHGILMPNQEFIAKPFTAHELAAKVRNVLGPSCQPGIAPSELPAVAREGGGPADFPGTASKAYRRTWASR